MIAALVILHFFTGAAASEPSRAAAAGADDIAYGPKDATLSVIEYSDLECRFYAEYAKIIG